MVSLNSPAMTDFELAVRMSYTYYTGVPYFFFGSIFIYQIYFVVYILIFLPFC